ncbi:superinfection immunity protein [Flavobacterium sp. LC2016-01]|uniref:superinfection immunity protein n=1 Tax=Flavobacterium sp. LC2016-01 TaxID=2675876 RepID=UPI0012BA93B6|nr:superinfection immunity protein [Flavobacterium sp. LC2016-01]MTH16755.1 superinfection immunity protein [Flavobacterium sp. LC2016-01]
MKIIFLDFQIFLFQSFLPESSLPFENNEITIEKIMAGFFALGIYFIPTIIARDKIQFKYILLLNLLTGWTVLGWFVCLMWAMNAKSKNSDSQLELKK